MGKALQGRVGGRWGEEREVNGRKVPGNARQIQGRACVQPARGPGGQRRAAGMGEASTH